MVCINGEYFFIHFLSRCIHTPFPHRNLSGAVFGAHENDADFVNIFSKSLLTTAEKSGMIYPFIIRQAELTAAIFILKEKTMKLTKIISLILAALLLTVCFAACGNKDEGKTLKMATNAYFQPYEYYDGDKIIGIDAEIAEAICEYLGYELEIVDMEFDSIITSIEEGSCDFGMAGMTVSAERLEDVDFSSSYATGVQVVIVKEDSAITSVDDIADSTGMIGVQLGTTGDIYASDDYGADRVTSYNNGNSAVLALLGGSVECVILDNEPAKKLVEANPGLKILDTTYADEDYAICVQKGNSELLEKINEALDALTADGTIDGIVAKYIK